jgi:hypothetical protein
LEQVLQWVQIVVSILTLAGVAFAVGRLVGRIDTVERAVNEIRDALFGAQQNGDGAFIRKTEVVLMLDSMNKQQAAFDDRLTEIASRQAPRRAR